MSIISKLFNKITNKRLPAPEQNEPREQYTYKQIIDFMNSNKYIEEFYQQMDKINEITNMYYPSQVHGIEHTSRVTFLATVLTKLDNLDEHTQKLILTSAILHDIGRKNDKETKEHGVEGKEKVEQEGLLADFTKNERKIIEFVVEQHSLSREENEKALKKIPFWQRDKYSTVLSYLKDADALDRVRIANKNAQLDPSRLRTRTAKELVNFSYENFQYFPIVVMYEYKLHSFSNGDPILIECAKLVRDSISLDWMLQNKEFLKNCYNRGILQNLKKDGIPFIDYLENRNLMEKTFNQVSYGDFEYLRENGYNITYQSFLEIVSSYKEGTLETLRNNGKLQELFSYETFKQYGMQQSFNDRLTNGEEIEKTELFNAINKNKTTLLTKETFDRQFMLYKNMYSNHKDAFDLFNYCDIDINFSALVGPIEKVQINDLNIIREKGYNLSLRDLVLLSAEFSPEEYRDIIDSNNAEKLFSYNPTKDKDGNNFKSIWSKISKQNPEISEQDFIDNYQLYKVVALYNENIYSIPEIKNYSIKEIYPALTKIQETELKLNLLKNKNLRFNAQNLLDLIEFSRKTKILDNENEEENDKIIGLLIENGKWKDDPRLIEYVTKKNKIYKIENIEDLLNYNEFCINKILIDNNISLEDAKSNLINSLVNIDCPNKAFRQELEENIIDELYYYKKYKKEEKIAENVDKENDDFTDTVINNIINVMDSTNIQEFKDKLYSYHKNIENCNFNALLDKTRSGS